MHKHCDIEHCVVPGFNPAKSHKRSPSGSISAESVDRVSGIAKRAYATSDWAPVPSEVRYGY